MSAGIRTRWKNEHVENRGKARREVQIQELTDETTAWSKLMLGIAGATARWDKHRVESNIELINVMVGLLYTNYQYDSPYIQQVEMNMEMAKVYFQMRFNKKLDF